MAPPLFIVGTSRSGTSWAFELCASHPDMSMGYESKLPTEGAVVHERFAGSLDRPGRMQELFDALDSEIDDPSNVELFGRLRDPAVVEAAVAANRAAPGWPSICEAIMCSLESTSHWGNKQLRIELMDEQLRLWPDARFLVLTRDPRGVMASQRKKFDHSIDYSATYWNTHARWIRERLGLRPGEHDATTMVVDVVEMARDARPALTWAFEAVGLDTSPVDDLMQQYPGDPGRLDEWRGALDPNPKRRIEELCFTEMRHLGYEPELAEQQREIGRLRRFVAICREHGSEILRDPSALRRKRVGHRVKAALGIGR